MLMGGWGEHNPFFLTLQSILAAALTHPVLARVPVFLCACVHACVIISSVIHAIRLTLSESIKRASNEAHWLVNFVGFVL